MDGESLQPFKDVVVAVVRDHGRWAIPDEGKTSPSRHSHLKVLTATLNYPTRMDDFDESHSGIRELERAGTQVRRVEGHSRLLHLSDDCISIHACVSLRGYPAACVSGIATEIRCEQLWVAVRR